ncbi:MAG: hypothetical protein ABSG36_03980 [Acidimicrobiales bacterium]|jgi:hypothetical protein
MAGLARRGGVIAARDGDYGAFTWWPASRGLERWREVYSAVARRNAGEPNAGRFLLSWARAAGWSDPVYSSSTWTFATAEGRTWWSQLWAERCTTSSFARQAVEYAIATLEELEVLGGEWRAWAEDPGGVFIVVHAEVIGHR